MHFSDVSSLYLRKSARNFNAPMAKAAKITIAEVLKLFSHCKKYYLTANMSVCKLGRSQLKGPSMRTVSSPVFTIAFTMMPG